MSRMVLWLVSSILLIVAVTGCSRTANKQPDRSATSGSESQAALPSEGPPADVVEASASQIELTAGGSAAAVVKIKIAPGYHINANPSSKYQIATVLMVESSGGITAGKVTYPPSITKKFSFSADEILVYEGEVVVTQPLRADADVAKGNRTMVAKLRIQPCDETVCYPPRTLGVSIPIIVK